ncbi:MAG: hypothetical protein FWG83_06525 [Oscillospiraceae bacterium]|nr:hypothetical protein [Oscillospiraceae bacterium]
MNEFDEAVKAVIEPVVKQMQEQIDSLRVRIDEAEFRRAERKAERKSQRKGAFAKIAGIQGAITGETGRESPDGRVDFSKLSYNELCAFLERNPQAKLRN